MNKEQPNYYAILTADVRYDKNLSANAKLLYAEITALCGKNGKCWANNKYFAELYGADKRTIGRWINELVKGGYIDLKIIYKTGTKEIEKRYLTLACKEDNFIEEIDKNIFTESAKHKNKNELDPSDKNVNTYGQNCRYPHDKNVNTPIDKNVLDNNTRLEYYKKNNNLSIIFLSRNRKISCLGKDCNCKKIAIAKLGNKNFCGQHLRIELEKLRRLDLFPRDLKNEQENKPKLLFDLLEENPNLEKYEKEILDFISYRKTIKKALNTTLPIKAYIKALEDLQELGYNFNFCIQQMKSNEWQTLKVDYIHKPKKQGNNQGYKSKTQIRNEFIDDFFAQQEKLEENLDIEEAEIEEDLKKSNYNSNNISQSNRNIPRTNEKDLFDKVYRKR